MHWRSVRSHATPQGMADGLKVSKIPARLRSPTGFDQSKALAWRGWGQQQRQRGGNSMGGSAV